MPLFSFKSFDDYLNRTIVILFAKIVNIFGSTNEVFIIWKVLVKIGLKWSANIHNFV